MPLQIDMRQAGIEVDPQLVEFVAQNLNGCNQAAIGPCRVDTTKETKGGQPLHETKLKKNDPTTKLDPPKNRRVNFMSVKTCELFRVQQY